MTLAQAAAGTDLIATTDANGNFQFAAPSAGTYTVSESLLGGVLLSAPTGGSYQVTLSIGTNISGQNFGNVLTSLAVPITLPPATPFPSQGNANADYVEAVYRAVLQRNADPAGLSYWAGQLNGQTLSRLQVVQGIRDSVEHFQQEIGVFYQTLLGRSADPDGLAFWVGQLQTGVPEEQIAADFLTSDEYVSKGDKYFIDSMYESLLGRAFDPSGETYWLCFASVESGKSVRSG